MIKAKSHSQTKSAKPIQQKIKREKKEIFRGIEYG